MGIILFIAPPLIYNTIEGFAVTRKFKRGLKFRLVLEGWVLQHVIYIFFRSSLDKV